MLCAGTVGAGDGTLPGPLHSRRFQRRRPVDRFLRAGGARCAVRDTDPALLLPALRGCQIPHSVQVRAGTVASQPVGSDSRPRHSLREGCRQVRLALVVLPRQEQIADVALVDPRASRRAHSGRSPLCPRAGLGDPWTGSAQHRGPDSVLLVPQLALGPSGCCSTLLLSTPVWPAQLRAGSRSALLLSNVESCSTTFMRS